MNEDEKRPASAGGPVESFGTPAPGEGTFGSDPPGEGTFGTPSEGEGTFGSPAPTESKAPASGGNRNISLLVGGGIAVLVILAAILGFVMK